MATKDDDTITASANLSTMNISEPDSVLNKKKVVVLGNGDGDNKVEGGDDASKSKKSSKSKNKKSKSKGGGGNGGGGGGNKVKVPDREWTEGMQEDYERILSVGEECISSEELKRLIIAKGRGIEGGSNFNLYDGFEPSGRMHIAQGVFKAMNVNKCTHPGTNSTFVFWVADWFALMNDKMGGDLEKIKIVGQYLIEVWSAAGMDLRNVKFQWASEEITKNAHVYWPTMLDVARSFNITRIKKCCQIMGRLEGNLTTAQVLYPLMQCTDVFFLKADICQLGVDQRKVNMLAREYCDAVKKKNKPVILSHHMLYGLKAGQEKMSKSDPDSAIFMEDTADDVIRKINNAYCPLQEETTTSTTTATTTTTTTNSEQKEDADAGKESMHLIVDTLKNPCLDYIQYIILSPPGATFTANDTTYTEFVQVRADFLSGKISEQQLKLGLITELNQLLEPVRQHFTNNERAKHLLEQVRQFKKEDSTSQTKKKEFRRLDLVQLGKIKPKSHVVFASLPKAKPTLEDAHSILLQLKAAASKQKESGDDDAPIILFFSDWEARVRNACMAEQKPIDAYYTILETSLRALDDSDLMTNKVTILRQSEAILLDPSNYWISVINAGRHFMLNDVMGSNVQDADGVGHVIGRLMKIADVLGMEPASITFAESDVDSQIENNLIARFYNENVKESLTTQPNFQSVNCPSLVLQQKDLQVHKTDNDEYFLLDDPKVNGKSKMKKAFCQEGNVEFCPPILLACQFGTSEIVIQRSPDNGGDVTYRTDTNQMETDFASTALHPGDLKAAASTIMVEVLGKLSSAIKADPKATQASKALKAFEKKLAKSSKKK
uniref:tyrosine--tRNA ligase n=1 Tax=Eucampia antarctica TaxID=49252 RepID=A0A7S2R661_9STRA|mmetsp:Transcript_17603/g.17053  ORF Transcript_17603/g.17053 Transcript_17603/m.17053 type:complete len:834 (+) Transcript_17603:44-2545(+)